MSVQRDKFTPAIRPVVPPVPAVPIEPIRRAMWAQRQREVPWWRPGARKELAKAVVAAAWEEARRQWEYGDAQRAHAQEQADTWWQQLNAGDVSVVIPTLTAAFSDNAAPVIIDKLTPTSAQLRVSMPGPDVLPAKTAHVTPSGRSSVRAWTAAERDGAYRALLGAHLLATLREAWAVAPSLSEVNVVGQRAADARLGFLFSITAHRPDGGWEDDAKGLGLLDKGPRPLRRATRSGGLILWPFDEAEETPVDPVPSQAPVKSPGTPPARPGPTSPQKSTATRQAAVQSEKLRGEEIVAQHGAGNGPTWVGRRGGQPVVASDAATGEWRTRLYETRRESMAGKANWMPVGTFVVLVLTGASHQD